MSAIMPALKLDDDAVWRRYFLPYQARWILDEARLCLAEKSVRIGWTFADAFKNVRKRLRHPRRDYLFTSKDEATALEYLRACQRFCEWFDFTRFVISRGMVTLKTGRRGGAGAEIKAGQIKFDNGSRILAFSSNPNALRAYGGDVGMDEFAFHPEAAALWAAASGRATWGYDLAVWSSHNGAHTLFHRFAREAAAGLGGWSYYRVTMPEALDLGLLEKINAVTGRTFTREQFLADCQARARLPEVFEQEYLCQPAGDAAALVPWQVLERCLTTAPIERRHLEAPAVESQFGAYDPRQPKTRAQRIRHFLREAFSRAFGGGWPCRLGFDVAASGAGDLAAFYVDQWQPPELRLAALLTCRTQDWHFLATTLETFLRELPAARGCGDETGLGRQICWEAARQFPGAFRPVNFSREKTALGFLLLNQLTAGAKRVPRDQPDIAADFMALRKVYRGGHWTFTEGRNPLNPDSHGDIAWAGALASRANETPAGVQAVVLG